MANIIPDRMTMQNIERLNIETCRFSRRGDADDEHVPAGHADLATGADRRRARVVVEQHQYVTRVEDGGQAVIGPKVRTRGGVRNGGGR